MTTIFDGRIYTVLAVDLHGSLLPLMSFSDEEEADRFLATIQEQWGEHKVFKIDNDVIIREERR